MRSAAVSSVLFPLSLADQGDRVRILCLRLGTELERRLRDLGLREDSIWEVTGRRADGALVVVGDTLPVILTAAMAERIAGVPVWEGGAKAH